MSGENEMERRLRAALAARAESVTPESLRAADVPVVQPRRGWAPGWLTRPRGLAIGGGVLAGAMALTAVAVMLPRDAGTFTTSPDRAAQQPTTAPPSDSPTGSASASPSPDASATVTQRPSASSSASSSPSSAPSRMATADWRQVTVAGVRLRVPPSWKTETFPPDQDDSDPSSVPGVQSGCLGTSPGDCTVSVARSLTPAAKPVDPRVMGGGLMYIDEAHICFSGDLRTLTQRSVQIGGERATFTDIGCPGDSMATWAFPRSGVAFTAVRNTDRDRRAEVDGAEVRRIVDAIVDSVQLPSPAIPSGNRTTLHGVTLSVPRGWTYETVPSSGDVQVAQFRPTAEGTEQPKLTIIRARPGTRLSDNDLNYAIRGACDDAGLGQASFSTATYLGGRVGKLSERECKGVDVVQSAWVFQEPDVVFVAHRDTPSLDQGLARAIQSASF